MSDRDQRPYKTPGHAWFCDCGTCMGDGNESQWHRRAEPHPCARLNGQWWWPGVENMEPWQRDAYAGVHPDLPGTVSR